MDRRSGALEVAQPWEADRCHPHSTRRRQPHLRTDSQHNDRNLATRRHREVRRFCRRTTPAMGTCRGETMEGSRNRKHTRSGDVLLNWNRLRRMSNRRSDRSPTRTAATSSPAAKLDTCATNGPHIKKTTRSRPTLTGSRHASLLVSSSRPGHKPRPRGPRREETRCLPGTQDSSKHTGLIPKMIQEGSVWFLGPQGP